MVEALAICAFNDMHRMKLVRRATRPAMEMHCDCRRQWRRWHEIRRRQASNEAPALVGVAYLIINLFDVMKRGRAAAAAINAMNMMYSRANTDIETSFRAKSSKMRISNIY